jgi:hypothetical protein
MNVARHAGEGPEEAVLEVAIPDLPPELDGFSL